MRRVNLPVPTVWESELTDEVSGNSILVAFTCSSKKSSTSTICLIPSSFIQIKSNHLLSLSRTAVAPLFDSATATDIKASLSVGMSMAAIF